MLKSMKSPTWKARFRRACGCRCWMSVSLRSLKERLHDQLALKLVEAALALDRVSAQAERPEIDDDIGQSFRTAIRRYPACWPCLPKAMPLKRALMMKPRECWKLTPEPNLIIPFEPGIMESVQRRIPDVRSGLPDLAAASRLVDLMPDNDKWIIGR